MSDLPEDSVVFLCRLCQSEGPGVSGEGEVGWRRAVRGYKEDSFRKVVTSMKPPAVATSLYSALLEKFQGLLDSTVVSARDH